MQIIFSDHAVERIHARDISRLKVYATVKSPQKKIKSYRDRIIYARKFGIKTLEVVTKLESDNLIIISAYMVK